MFLYKVCRGLVLGFWLDFYMIEGFLQVLFVRSFFFFCVFFGFLIVFVVFVWEFGCFSVERVETCVENIVGDETCFAWEALFYSKRW